MNSTGIQVTKSSYDAREAIKTLMFQLNQESQRNILEILASTLSGRKNLRIRYTSSPCANVKDGWFGMPPKLHENGLFDWLLKKGSALHETFHLLYTGKMKFPSGVKDEALFHEITNVIEDARVELLGIDEFEGTGELITLHNSYGYSVRKDKNDHLLLALCFKLKGFDTEYSKDKKLFAKCYEVAKEGLYEDWEGCLKAVKKVYDLLYIEKPKPPVGGDTNGGTEKSEDGDEGEGDGEGNGEGEGEDEEDGEENESSIPIPTGKDNFDNEGKKSTKKIKSKPEQKQLEEKVGTLIEQMEKLVEEIEKGNIDEIEVVFSKDNATFKGVDKQNKEKAEAVAKKIEEDIEDAEGMNKEGKQRYDISVEIPDPTSSIPISVKECDSIAKALGDDLNAKLVIGEETESRHTSGLLNIKHAVGSIVQNEISDDFDERIYDQTDVVTPEHDVLILLDHSDSMNESAGGISKINGARTATYTIAKAMEAIGVPVSIRGYRTDRGGTTETKDEIVICDLRIKGWDDELTAKEICGFKANGGTPTGTALRLAGMKFEDREHSLKILISVTDGLPDNSDNAKKEVEELTEKGITTIGVFLGNSSMGESTLEEYKNQFKRVYGERFVVVNNLDKLRKELVKQYEEVLSESTTR